MNRKIAPQFKPVKQVELIKPEIKYLDNGIPVHIINAGTQEIAKVEFLFNAGAWFEPSTVVAHSTSRMIMEGTSKMSSAEVAERVDAFGAFLDTESDRDFGSLTLHCLNKHLKSTLPIVHEVLLDAAFHEDELNTFVSNSKQKLIVNEKKVNVLSGKLFSEMLFGINHPYGYRSKIEDYDNLNRETLAAYHKQRYANLNCN